MFDTMEAANGAGLAAPQIGVDLQLVIFGFDHNARYPDAPPVPRTVLINPMVTPIGNEEEEGWEGCLSVPGLRGVVPRHFRRPLQRLRSARPAASSAKPKASMPASSSTSAITSSAASIPTRMRDLTRLGFTSVLFPDLDPASDD